MDYELHELNFIKDDYDNFITDCFDAKKRFDSIFPEQSSTWTFGRYNIFNLTMGSKRFYKLYHEIKNIARNYLKTDEPLWIQSWLNFHKMHEVLEWHDHKNCSAHGYVSINPMKTKTIFEDYVIDNEIGKLYIGKPHLKHKVVNMGAYEDTRITIAFDIADINDYEETNKDWENINIGYIPI